MRGGGGAARRLRPAHVPMAALLLAAGTLAAQEEVRIETAIDTTLITVGDRVTMSVTVEHPAGWVVEWPDSLDAPTVELLAVEVGGTIGLGEEGRERSAASFAFTSFGLGEAEVPSFEIAVVAPDGTTEAVATDAYGIAVQSVGVDESGAIRDIRGPLSVPGSPWRFLPWIALAALLAVVVALYIRRRRRPRPGEASAIPRAPPRPAHLVALEALAELERSQLLERGRVMEYHVRVSEVVRAYLEGQFEVPALELATGEVVDAMRAAALGATIVGGFQRFLESCDLVKFAKARPGIEESRALLPRARELVAATSPAQAVASDTDGEMAHRATGAAA